jgi:hypothetical protein
LRIVGEVGKIESTPALPVLGWVARPQNPTYEDFKRLTGHDMVRKLIKKTAFLDEERRFFCKGRRDFMA